MKCNRKHDTLVPSQITFDRGEGENEYECNESEYLKVLQEKYLMASVRKEKSSILDEYCSNTHQNRKYVIRKIRSRISLVPKRRGGKKIVYDGYVRVALAKIWEIFDYPCGQRLSPLLKTEVARLKTA